VKVAVLSDIHANLVALETVLAAIGAVDAIWVCGDTVGYGPDPSDVLALLIERKATIVAGNHDRAVARNEDLELFNRPAALAVRMHQSWLSAAERDTLAALPKTLETDDVTLCHGSLRDPLWEYVTNPRSATASLALAKTAHCCAGHTHVPALFRERPDAERPGRVRYETPYPLVGRVFLNPGSVGQPRDGSPMASYGIWDVTNETFEFRRVKYDIKGAQRAIRKARLPERFALRLETGR